ncbi:MAG: hypothetical protein ACOX2F_08940 [bacterium]
MKTSSKIIAVNKDKSAEIFSVADVGFVMDVEEWINRADSFFKLGQNG